MTTLKDLRRLVPVDNLVREAAGDMWTDVESVRARYRMWAIRGLKKLTRETLKSPKRYASLTVNKNLNNAVLPCDFDQEIFVGFINSCMEKVPLTLNPNIVNPALIESLPCAAECEAKCGCLPKQICNDIQTTQVINKITINDTQYDETVTSTLMPNGEYYNVITTPFLKTFGAGGIDYITRREYVTSFDVADCGCIESTERNKAKLQAVCPEAYCCYCAPCTTNNSGFGGYQIFKENGIIQFDGAMIPDKLYLEYTGFLPRMGNEYLVPEEAGETIIEWTKFKSIQNKKGIAQWERKDQFNHYTRERDNMTKVLGRTSLDNIIHSMLLVPKFDYIGGYCYPSGTITPTAPPQVITETVYVQAPPAASPPPSTSLKPPIITLQGSEMDGGVTYNNSILASAISFRVFANPFNRFLNPDEYTILPTGGFTILIGGPYGLGDWFDIIPKWA